MSSSDTNPWTNFCDPHWELIFCNKWHPWISKISTPTEIAVGTHFHMQPNTKATPVFSSADGEVSWLLPPSLVSLLSGSTVQPENTCSCILKVTDQVWESKKRITSVFSIWNSLQVLKKSLIRYVADRCTGYIGSSAWGVKSLREESSRTRLFAERFFKIGSLNLFRT